MSSASARKRSAADTAPVFAALGDATRLTLVRRLSTAGPLPIVQLCQGSPVTRQAVTKHLHVLANAGLVRHARRGRERIWELEPGKLAEARRFLDLVSGQWDEAIGRLRAFVERPAPPRRMRRWPGAS
jgi:DNA-binding transcriptional ArsR family regulator